MAASWREVRDELLAAGWSLAARGDWAWVYRSADGARAARLCAYDPAYRLHVRCCQFHAGNPYLPTVLELRELEDGGHLTVMPWLDAVSEREADELAARLGFGAEAAKRLGEGRVEALAQEGARDPALRDIRRILRELVEEGERELPYFGGTDLRAANILAAPGGQLQLVDPIFVAGREIIAALRRDPAEVAKRIGPASLRAFLQLACFEGAEVDPDFRTLRAIVSSLEA